MFWGLIMEPNKRYTQVVEKPFHVSMASLDLTTADDNLVQVMLGYDNRNFLLCSLKKDSTWQVPLDLNFQEGTKIAFTCNGQGHVHLSGYVISNEDLDLDELEDEKEEEEVPQLVDKNAKRKATESLKNQKNIKRSKQDIKTESSGDEEIELDSDSTTGSEVIEHVEDIDDFLEDERLAQKKAMILEQRRKNKEKQEKTEDINKLVNGKDAKQDQQSKQQKKTKGKQEQQQSNKQNTQIAQNVQTNEKIRIETGVEIEELKIGSGAVAEPGKVLHIHYVGRFKNGKKFDSSTVGKGMKFKLGSGDVIRGIDLAVVGMQVGGKRRVTIPPKMAYGSRGSPPLIPKNSTLIFEIELEGVH